MCKVTCPYCGGEMKLVRYGWAYWYECMRSGCRMHSPAAGTKVDALEKAMAMRWVSTWHSVKDGLPDNGTICVVHGHNKRGVDCYDIAVKSATGWDFGSLSRFEIEHWMLVPGRAEGGNAVKTPDEIKRGLAACAEDDCKDCAYYKGKATCLQSMIADALAYIKQLEAERVADGRRDIRVPTNRGVENDQQKRL